MKQKTKISKIINRIINGAFVAVLLLILFLLLNVFCFASFKIPSDSMEPELISGDYVLVNKLIMGARLFNISAAFNKEEFNIYRMPGLSEVKRNDVLVFNFPFSQKKDSISFNLMNYYIKRCIGLPGDSVEIVNAHYRVKGFEEEFGNVLSQDKLATILEDDSVAASSGIVIYGYPRDRKIGWSIRNFGPFYLPEKGKQIVMDRNNVVIYRPLIEWEQKKRLRWRKDKAVLGENEITHYTFQSNYYFVAGDKVENSKDSRYWGALPEEFIVGKASLIWKSKDSANRTRWERVMKKIN
ncbi:signal peptidase I [Bacteroides sp. 224]|uniref:signal peptidase I n=1 Tax=Bacteroides sp. 224 TaxID=2302936 RepID=UPI0013D527C9|nr:signal peptidase I [Bacteroides sp. 224]NDV66545.1 signal peptidase I [Bacteroides sp. 224]